MTRKRRLSHLSSRRSKATRLQLSKIACGYKRLECNLELIHRSRSLYKVRAEARAPTPDFFREFVLGRVHRSASFPSSRSGHGDLISWIVLKWRSNADPGAFPAPASVHP